MPLAYIGADRETKAPANSDQSQGGCKDKRRTRAGEENTTFAGFVRTGSQD